MRAVWKIGICDYFPCTVILWHSDVSVWHSLYGTKKNVHTNRLFIQSHSTPLSFQMFIYWAILDLYCICCSEVIKKKEYRILIDMWFLLSMRWIYELFLPFILRYMYIPSAVLWNIFRVEGELAETVFPFAQVLFQCLTYSPCISVQY
jgi:hypothetical protein